MGLDIWFQEDIRNALLAAEEAASSTARMVMDINNDPGRLTAYMRGFRAGLATVALAFGLSPSIFGPEDREVLRLLEAAAAEAQKKAIVVEVEGNVVHDLPDRVWESDDGAISGEASSGRVKCLGD